MNAVVIVGGGPAGLMAAEVISAAGVAVCVYERMPSVGRKLLMAGRGGLNLTHGEPLERLLERYGPAGRFLASFVADHPPTWLVAWANGLGQETFSGSSGRIFPKAMKASPLLRAWLARLQQQGVEFRLHHRWLGFEGDQARFERPDGSIVLAPPAPVVLALGGASWPRLGSDGGWIGSVEGLGATVKALTPANAGVRIVWSEHFRGRFEGLPLKRIAVSVGKDTVRGEAVITRGGLEGGAIYALNPLIREQVARSGRAELTIDLRPDADPASLASRLERPRGKQSLATWLRKSAGLTPQEIGLLRENTGATLPADAAGLAHLIKSVRLDVVGLAGLERAISSAGGIDLEALDRNLMLRGRPGIFAAGEMLDWEAPTGGYLLQACFSTGHAAGLGVLRHLHRLA